MSQSKSDSQRLAAALVNAANNQEDTEVESVMPTSPGASTALSANENTAFDVGLLIAAPIILGTLGLFFVFPLLIPSLQNSLPPPP